MRRLILLSVFLLVLSGCSVKRHAVSHVLEEVSSETTEVSSSASDSSFETEDSLWYEVSKNCNFDAHIIVYDTSLPVDSATGKRPVKIEAVISSHSESSSAGGSVAQSSSESSTRANSARSSVYEYDLVDDSESDVSSESPSYWNLIVFCAIIALAGIGTFIRFFRR